MGIADHAERLGKAAENGEMTQREAAHELKRLYPGTTIPGALELVKNWRDVRRHYGMPGPYPPPRSP
jgi:hypothetical protein